MNKYFLSIGLLLFCLNIQAQMPCTPDSTYADSMAGVYPLPYDPSINPDGGIQKPACIGQEYEFLFTVVVGDSITVPVGPGIQVKLNYIQLDTDNAVDGLPAGLDYQCYPPDCRFESNELGCVIIEGEVDQSNTPGIYPLTIFAQVSAEGFGLIDLSFPGSFYPGEYNIEVHESSEPECASDISSPEQSALNLFPNPLKAGEPLHLEGTREKILQWTLLNVQGVVVDQGHPPSGLLYPIQTHRWTSGVYVLHIQTEETKYARKVIVTKNP